MIKQLLSKTLLNIFIVLKNFLLIRRNCQDDLLYAHKEIITAAHGYEMRCTHRTCQK